MTIEGEAPRRPVLHARRWSFGCATLCLLLYAVQVGMCVWTLVIPELDETVGGRRYRVHQSIGWHHFVPVLGFGFLHMGEPVLLVVTDASTGAVLEEERYDLTIDVVRDRPELRGRR